MKIRRNTTISDGQIKYFRKLLPIMYLGIILIMSVMLVVNVACKEKSKVRYGLNEYSSILSDWEDDEGNSFEFDNIDSYVMDGNETISAYFQLPDNLEGEQTIVFRSKNTYVQVYIGEELVYNTKIADVPFYNHSPGTRWNMVKVTKEDSGKTIKMLVTRAYVSGHTEIDNIYMGDRAAILLGIIKEKALGLLVCVLIFFVGILYMFANTLLNLSRKSKEHSLLYLGIFAVICSIWCFIETNVLQLFLNNLRFIQVVDNMMLVLGGMPLYFYMDSTYQVFKNRFIKWLACIDMAYICLSTVSQICGLWDYQQTINGAICTYGVVSIILIFYVVRQRIRLKKEGRKNIYVLLQQTGITMLGISIAIDFICYYKADEMDCGFSMRIGLFVFLICFGAGNIYRLGILVKQGMQSEIISKLAYSDGLTEVRNRTAYIEWKEKLIRRKEEKRLGIVLFDINNLKQVNDFQGHQAGDKLIQDSVEIINQSFGKVGEVFRIGGDEFTVLIYQDEPDLFYNQAVKLFRAQLELYNANEGKEFWISIAHGYSICKSITANDIVSAENEADLKMYQNKSQLKSALQCRKMS